MPDDPIDDHPVAIWAMRLAATSPAEEAKKALIAAALERAKQQKSQVRPRNTDNLSADKLAEIDEIEARRTQPPGATIEPPESK